jgi:hypothetical protein
LPIYTHGETSVGRFFPKVRAFRGVEPPRCHGVRTTRWPDQFESDDLRVLLDALWELSLGTGR